MAVRIYRLRILQLLVVELLLTLFCLYYPSALSPQPLGTPVRPASVFCYHFGPGGVKESFSKAGHLMVLINVCVYQGYWSRYLPSPSLITLMISTLTILTLTSTTD